MRKFLFLALITSGLLVYGCSSLFQKSSDSGERKEAANDYTRPAVQNEVSKPDNKNADRTDGEKPADKAGEYPVNVNSRGAGEKKDGFDTSISVTLYYQDKDGYLVPVTVKLARQEGIARAAVSGLVDDAISREELAYYGIYPVLPKGTEILGINIKDDTATIDFNANFLGYKDEISERNVVASIVYTLTGFKTINNVRIQVNGYPQKKQKFNTDISGILNRSNVMLNTKKVNAGTGQGKLDIFLYKKITGDLSCLVPVSVETPSLKNEELPGKIIELLGKEYQGTGLYTQLPPKVRLLGSSLNGNVLTIDLSSDVRNYGGTSREDGILNQLLYSMRQVKGANKLKILIDGKNGTLPEGTEISKGIDLPQEINAIME